MLKEALIGKQYVVDVAQNGELAWDWVQVVDFD